MEVVRTLFICTFLLWFSTVASALNPDRNIHQLAHRSWGEKDGYPGRALALAQTIDGFLWLGTDNGLWRFDGVHFERYVSKSGDKLPEVRVRSLLALPDGSLWIAGDEIFLLRNGNVKSFGKTDGVTSNPLAIVQDHEGTIWANTWTGVIRFDGTRWERIGKGWNFPEDVPHVTSQALFVDSRGTLWAGVNNTVLYLKHRSKRFEPTGVFAGYSWSIAEASDGTIWLADNYSYVRAISTSVSAKSAATARCEVERLKGTPPKCPDEEMVVEISAANDLLFDRNGSLWVGTDSSGLGRIPYPERMPDGLKVRQAPKNGGALEMFASKDGLSSDNCDPLIEDREGNIWVASRDGLDQFRDTALVPVALPKSIIQVAIAPAGDGDLWVAGSWNYLGRIYGNSSDVSLVSADAYKPYRDHTGVTWLMGNSLWQWKDGRFQKVAQSPDGLVSSFGTWQVADDGVGRLWAFSNGHGFFTLDNHRWKAWLTPPEVAKQTIADMFSDSTGRIWVSTYEGDVITMDNGNVVEYPVKPGRPLSNVKAFAEHSPQEIWAGGSGGLALIDRGHFRLIRPAAADSFKEVTGIVDAGSEGLWLNSSDGVIHIPKDEVDRTLRDPSNRFQWERFDSSDGLPGTSEDIFPFPKAAQGTDGRIWFTATRGVAWIDPKRIPRNTSPPPVSITSVSADGSPHIQFADLRLPARTANVEISYTALSLSVPERVHFRYRLEDSDKDWQEVGTRREAFYTNLGPHHYRFRVIACNEDGVWNNVGAHVEFTIAPAWYQTAWFRASCVATFLVFVWALYQLRVRQIGRAAGFHHEVQTALAHANRLAAMGQVTASIAHEVNQPIAGTIINAQVALTSLGSNAPDLEKVNQALHRIVRDGNRAAQVVDRVRAMTKNAPATKDNVALNDAVAEVVDMARWQAVKHGVSVRAELAQVLPSIQGDRVQLQQVVLNLIINAIEAISGTGDGTGELIVRTEVGDGGDVLVIVADSGPGLAPATLTKLFEPFYTTKPNGLGLGLSICRSIVEAHGGQLSAHANVPRGTVFQFSVPAEPRS